MRLLLAISLLALCTGCGINRYNDAMEENLRVQMSVDSLQHVSDSLTAVFKMVKDSVKNLSAAPIYIYNQIVDADSLNEVLQRPGRGMIYLRWCNIESKEAVCLKLRNININGCRFDNCGVIIDSAVTILNSVVYPIVLPKKD